MSTYRVFIAADVVAFFRTIPRRERELITNLFDTLAVDPFRPGDYVEQDEIGRSLQVIIIGRYAVFFWADHPVKEVKITGVKWAGR